MKTRQVAMNTKQQGFTLIELVVVIVILGILAAVAVPRFVNLQNDARTAVANGVNGAVQSASSLARAQILARNISNGGTTVIEGVTVTSAFGWPDGTSLLNLLTLQPVGNFTTSSTAAAATIQVNGANTPAQCQVTYTAPTAANNPPTYNLITTGC